MVKCYVFTQKAARVFFLEVHEFRGVLRVAFVFLSEFARCRAPAFFERLIKI